MFETLSLLCVPVVLISMGFDNTCSMSALPAGPLKLMHIAAFMYVQTYVNIV